MDTLSITVKVKSNYGTEAIYPVCDRARIFASIAGTKTLTRKLVEQVKSLGYVVKVETEQVRL